MSLLEDIFLEDEAGEAQELERIIEGDEFDERPRPSTPNSNENSEKEDEAEEDKRHVDPTTKAKRVVKNPRVILNPARLTGPRGIQVIPEHFKDFTFKGKGHEKEDLDIVLKKLEHWAYRLFPKFEFKDCLKKIETLGNKRPVMVHLTKIRSDQYVSEETVVQQDSSDEDPPAPEPQEDEFDRLLQQQIDLARTTPAPATGRKAFTTPMVDRSLPKATSSPSINEEQRLRMIRNRQLAEERRIARLKLNNTNTSNTENSELEHSTSNTIVNDITHDETNNSLQENELNIITDNTNDKIVDQDRITKSKHNRSNVIDSSDDEIEELVINDSVAVDIHHRHNDYDLNGHKNEHLSYNHDKQREEINNIDQTSNTEADIHIEDKINSLNDNEITNEQISKDNNIEIYDTYTKNKNNKNAISDTNRQEEVNSSITDHEIQNEKNTKESDIEMNDINNQNLTMINDDQNESDINFKDNIDTEILNKVSEINAESQSNDNNIQETERQEESNNTNEQTELADVDDIMDVDFTDDF